MTVLADTSVWIDYFRGSEPAASLLASLLDQDEVVLCGPVAAELLAGTASAQRETLWLALGALPMAETDVVAWRDAGERANELRQRGETAPLLDVLIAVVAVRAHASLWTRDADFKRVLGVLPALELYDGD